VRYEVWVAACSCVFLLNGNWDVGVGIVVVEEAIVVISSRL